jgi:hypothetical protein
LKLLLKEYISTDWAKEHHLIPSNEKKEQQRWAKKLSKLSMQALKLIWECHNTFMHGKTKDDEQVLKQI